MTERSKSAQTGRPRKGSLVWRASGWAGRFWELTDGEWIRVIRPLGTDNKAVARRKLARLVAEANSGSASPDAEATKAIETVDSYAKGWLASRAGRGLPSSSNEKRYYERVWKPAIGHLALDVVRAAHAQAVLDDVAAGRILTAPKKGKNAKTAPRRYSRASMIQMRATLLRMFESAWREELLPENRIKRTSVPELEEQEKPRAVLEDSEIAVLLAHPEADPEIKLLVLLARTIGGLRTGDLNTLDWGAFGPEFATCTFVRRKTRKKKPAPVTHEIPALVRPFIAAWWNAHGRPTAGPVFPVRRGARAGEQKKQPKQSYAEKLRRELLRAGITRPELHTETATTRPTHFHATRAAYATALARAGTNVQTSILLTGHADPKVHQRYLDQLSVRVMPEGAVPALDTRSAALLARAVPKLPANENGRSRNRPQSCSFSEREKGFEPSTSTLARWHSTAELLPRKGV